MEESNTKASKRAVRAATGSVRTEVLKPSKEIQHDLSAFTQNKINLETIRRDTITRIIKMGRNKA